MLDESPDTVYEVADTELEAPRAASEAPDTVFEVPDTELGAPSGALGVVPDTELGAPSGELGVVPDTELGAPSGVLEVVPDTELGAPSGALGVVLDTELGAPSGALGVVPDRVLDAPSGVLEAAGMELDGPSRTIEVLRAAAHAPSSGAPSAVPSATPSLELGAQNSVLKEPHSVLEQPRSAQPEDVPGSAFEEGPDTALEVEDIEGQDPYMSEVAGDLHRAYMLNHVCDLLSSLRYGPSRPAPDKLALLTLVLGVACVVLMKYVASTFLSHPGGSLSLGC